MKHNTVKAYGESLITADATVTVLAAFSTEANKAYLVTARVLALNRAISADQAAGYVLYGTFRTDENGVLAQVGSTAATATMEDNAAWAALFAVSQTDAAGAANPEIRVTATGAAATSIAWRADVEVNRVGLEAENS